MTLSELIVTYYMTDKDKGYNSHLSLYEEIFQPYKDSARKVVEIGVNKAHSTYIWTEYFQNAHIYGLDNRESITRKIPPFDRLTFHCVDQSQTTQLKEFADANGTFDIIIDDASHIWNHQITTFETLWPYINEGGLYIIEDTITSYKKYFPNHVGGNISCVEYFKNMIDHINFNGYDDKVIEDPSLASDYQRTIRWIIFRSNSIVIKKSDRGL